GTISSALTAGTGKIGIRIPSHPFALLLAEAFGKPLTATSANVSGEVEAVSAEDVRTIFEDSVDLILDGGPVPGAEGSTVVDMTYSPPRQVRKGRIAFSRVLEVLGFSVTEAHDW
ncbi:MAG TPA: Sua5/YciO/YrdC/YwlC family protein, partial [Nitrospiria bacterium]